MAVEESVLRELCSRTLERTQLPELGRREEGKVRDSYIGEKRRTIVVSDRVSCFDVVVGTIPLKGQVLNQLAAFWFDRSRDIVKNHIIEVPDPSVSIVHEVEILPVEFVMRGYLTGVSNTSIWTAYEKGSRDYCGHALPEGMTKHQRLAEPMLTPTTKAAKGEHDELTSREAILQDGVVSEEIYDQAAAISHRLFAAGQEFAASRGMILVDTKYEIGLNASGELVVADEIHTPDSSRYWYADSYDAAMSSGSDPKSLDKEYVRRWLANEHGYRGEGPAPELTEDVRVEAAARYIEAYEQVTGLVFEANTEPPEERIRQNLGL
jgi:phosphoribosylaminoimidazole-succinocarboxamide synthase